MITNGLSDEPCVCRALIYLEKIGKCGIFSFLKVSECRLEKNGGSKKINNLIQRNMYKFHTDGEDIKCHKCVGVPGKTLMEKGLKTVISYLVIKEEVMLSKEPGG